MKFLVKRFALRKDHYALSLYGGGGGSGDGESAAKQKVIYIEYIL